MDSSWLSGSEAGLARTSGRMTSLATSCRSSLKRLGGAIRLSGHRTAEGSFLARKELDRRTVLAANKQEWVCPSDC